MTEAAVISCDTMDPYLEELDGEFSVDLYIKGVKCGHCVHKISNEIEQNLSILNFEFESNGHRLKLWSSTKLALSEMMEKIQSLGFAVIPLTGQKASLLEKQEYKKSLKQLATAGVCSGNIMLFSVAVYLGADAQFTSFFHKLSFVLVLPVLIYSAQNIWFGFYQSLKHFKFNLDFPIALALLTGMSLSCWSLFTGGTAIYFDSLSVVVFLVLSSRFLLSRYVENIYQANIVQFIPGVYQIRKLEEDSEVWVPLGGVRAGDRVRVLRGETLPVDGVLKSAEALVDQSVLTGESEPVRMLRGDMIFAGTKICFGRADVSVVKEGGQTRVGQLVQAVVESHKKERDGSFRYVSFFTGFVVLASLISFLVLWLTHGLNVAFYRSFAIVIVACPCAISFGLPLIRSFSGRLALKNGFLVKKTEVLKQFLNLTDFFFDKTGTLTTSEIVVNEADFDKLSKNDQLRVLSLESNLDHPISRGFRKFQDPDFKALPVEEFQYIPGRGIQGVIDGQLWQVFSDESSGPQKRVVLFVEGLERAKLSLSSDLKSGVEDFFSNLGKSGYKVSVLSGDTAEQVKVVENLVPVGSRGRFLSKATPEEKLKLVEDLKGQCVMVGDGFNDMAAMKAAEVSVCMPGALENNLNVADVTLLSGDLTQLGLLVPLAKKIRKTEIQLMAFASLYNVICIGLAIMGFITPVAAAILMPISSVTVLSLIFLQLRRL